MSISDVTFDLAGGSAIAAISPNGWHLAVVRHGLAVDFFDARDLCSSTPSTTSNPTLASALATGNNTATRASITSKKRKLGSLQGSFSTLDDVSALVWSPDSTMVAACMVSRGIMSVISVHSFHSIATVEAALNGTSSHAVWHPSSRALYWCGLAQTHVLSLIDGNTMVLDYQAKVVFDADSDATVASDSNEVGTSTLPLWGGNEPCPAIASAGSISPQASKPLLAFSNGDGFVFQQFQAQQQQPTPGGSTQNRSSPANNTASPSSSSSASSAATPPLFLCIVSPCAVAAQPSVPSAIRKNMIQDPQHPEKLINMSSAQSVASTTNIVEEAAGVISAPFNSKMSVTTEYFHVFSAIDHEHLHQFPILSSSTSSKMNGAVVIDTGCEFYVTSFHVSPFFIAFHDSFSSALVIYSHRGENVGPNKRNVAAYSVSSADSADRGATITMVHDRSWVSVFSAVSSSSASSPTMVQLFTVNLANPRSYYDPFSNSSSSSSFSASSSSFPLVVLAERIAADDLLDRERNEPMTRLAAANHGADPANTLPVVPPNRSMYEVLLPPSTQEQLEQHERLINELFSSSTSSSQSSTSLSASASTTLLSLIPGLRSKSLEGLCHDIRSRPIVEEFLRHTMRKTETRNMMDDVVTAAGRSNNDNQNNNKFSNNNSNKKSNLLTSAIYSRLVTTRNAVTATNSSSSNLQREATAGGGGSHYHNNINQSATSLGNNLHLLSAGVLAEIAPLAFQTFGYCATLAFREQVFGGGAAAAPNENRHPNQFLLAIVVPLFPTCVFIIDVGFGKVISILQHEHVVTTLNWKAPREMLSRYQQGSYFAGGQSSSFVPVTNTNSSTGNFNKRKSANSHHHQQQQQQQHHQQLADPVLAFTTDSHNGCLFLWTPESALCVAMPEIAKAAAHNYNNNKRESSSCSLLKEKDSEFSSATTTATACEHKKLHVACENPDCRRNWMHRQKELQRRRAFERGEIGGFRPSFAAWTEAGNTLFLIDTIRGSHTVASLI